MKSDGLRLVIWGCAGALTIGSALHAAPTVLQTERFGMPALTCHDAVYVPGGYSNRGMVNTIEKITPEAAETEILQVKVLPRYFHAGAVYEGKLYLVGGLTLQPGGTCGVALRFASEFEEVDPVKGSVRHLPPLPDPVARPGAAVVGHRLYIIGGERENEVRSQRVQIYDFKKGKWVSDGAEIPVAREGVVMESGGKIYAPGGYNGQTALTDFWVYDPEKNEWKRLPDLPVKLSAHHGVIADNQLYTFGDYVILNRVAAYDFQTGQWQLLNLDYKPARHQGGALLGERVFVVGGNTSPSVPYLNYIQMYTLPQLAAARRRPWNAGEEKPPLLPAASGEMTVGTRGGLESFALSDQPAPALEMELLDGRTWRLADYTGRVVVLDFWSVGCGPCVRALPELAALAKEFQDQEVVFAGVNLDPESRKKRVASLVKESHVTFAVGMGGSAAGRAYEVRAIPCLVVIGRDGRVQGRLVGFSQASKEILRREIGNLLANRPIPTAGPRDIRPPVCGMGRAIESSPPDPRFFRLKWKTRIEFFAYPSSGEIIEFQIPARYVTRRADNRLFVYSAEDGSLHRTVSLAAVPGAGTGALFSPNCIYLQNGETGTVVGAQTLYETLSSDSGQRRYRPQGVRWFGLSESGELLWSREMNEPAWSGTALYGLPIGKNRQVALIPSRNRFYVVDERGRILLEQAVQSISDRWIFRPAKAADEMEVLVVGREIACYQLQFPGPISWNPELFERRWQLPVSGADPVGRSEGRLWIRLPESIMVFRKGNSLTVMQPADGRIIFSMDIPEGWTELGMTGSPIYVRCPAGGRLVAVKSSAASEPATGHHLTLAAWDASGKECWRREMTELSSEARIAAVPAGGDREAILLVLWNRLLVLDAEGKLLAEQPMGVSADPLIVRAANDAPVFEILEFGGEISCYRWKPPAQDPVR